LIKSNPSMRGTTFWATFPHSGRYAVCLKRSQEFINGLLGHVEADLTEYTSLLISLTLLILC
jgi:hypothetical protein